MNTVTKLLESLKEKGILEAGQATKILSHLQESNDDADALTQLEAQGYLTSYQRMKISEGRSEELTLGPYVLQEKIGEGGMGRVYKAVHRILKSVRAVKIIRPECLVNRAAIDRFYREIELVSRLNHPNIILAHDAGQEGDIHYFVMEYAPGDDLSKLLKKQNTLPIHLACDYIRQAALGLFHAAERDLVHRDLKPSNLLLSDEHQTIKILDMGLARLRDNVYRDDDETDDAPLTPSGAVIGTPDFMAPEQSDDPTLVDTRADIYALGCTLYQLLTGSLPFPGGTYVDKLIRHRTAEPVPVDERREEVPSALSALVQKMMEKRPVDRFQTAQEVADALAPFCTWEGIQSPANSSSAGTDSPHTEAMPGNQQAHATHDTLNTSARSQEALPSLGSFSRELENELEDVERSTREAIEARKQYKAEKEQRRANRKHNPMIIGVGLTLLALGGLFAWQPWSNDASVPPESPEPSKDTRVEISKRDEQPIEQPVSKDKKPITPPDKVNKDEPPQPKKDEMPQPKKDEKVNVPPPKIETPPKRGLAKLKNPDEKFIAFARRAKENDHGQARQLLHGIEKKELYSLARTNPLLSVRFSQDGQRVLTTTPTELALLKIENDSAIPLKSYDPNSTLKLQWLTGTPISQSAFSPSGDKIAFSTLGMSPNRIRNNPPTTRYNLIVVIGESETRIFYGDEAQVGRDRQIRSSVQGMIFSNDGKQLFVRTLNTVDIWNVNQREEASPTKSLRLGFRPEWLSCSPDGKYLLVANFQEKSIVVHSLGSPNVEPHCILEGHSSSVKEMTFVDNNKLLSGDRDGVIHLWNLPVKAVKKPIVPERSWKKLHQSAVRAIAIAPKGSRFVSGDESGALSFSSLENDEPVWKEKTDFIHQVGFTSKGNDILYGTSKGIYRRQLVPAPIAKGK